MVVEGLEEELQDEQANYCRYEGVQQEEVCERSRESGSLLTLIDQLDIPCATAIPAMYTYCHYAEQSEHTQCTSCPCIELDAEANIERIVR